MRNDFSRTQSAATFSGAKVYMAGVNLDHDVLFNLIPNISHLTAGYSLDGGAAGQELDPDFIENVRPLVNDPYNKNVLQSLVDNYGTHFVKTLYVGGIGT